MKKISEWELAWHNSLKYPKHGDLLYAIREEFRQAAIEAIKEKSFTNGGLSLPAVLLFEAITAIEQIGKE